MDHDALVLRVTPRRPEFVLGLENGDHTVAVKTSEQGLRDGRLWVESHGMTFRHVDGEWRLVEYSLGQA